jgi:hypothetical protein
LNTIYYFTNIIIIYIIISTVEEMVDVEAAEVVVEVEMVAEVDVVA